jgi:hypothetical protein
MPDMRPRRLRLWGEPGELARIDENVLEEARRRLRRQLADVELMTIDRQSANSIDVVLLVPASFRIGEVDEIASALRAALGIGSGPHALIGEDPGEVRGIGGEGRTCPRCHGSDGAHVAGCPNDRH